MGKITISVDEYRMLNNALDEANMMRNLLQKKLESGESIFSDEVKFLCTMFRIGAEKDA